MAIIKMKITQKDKMAAMHGHYFHHDDGNIIISGRLFIIRVTQIGSPPDDMWEHEVQMIITDDMNP